MKRLRKFCTVMALSALGVAAYAREFVTYEEYGAVGDGKADDQMAIVAAHKAANEKGLPVRAGDGKTYYIGGGAKAAVIQTDVNFGTAKFVIDDRNLENFKVPVFRVDPSLSSFAVTGVKKLTRGQANLGVSLPGPCLVEAVNDNVRQYIRYGLNQNKGSPQKEVFLVAADGTVDPATPIVWDYAEVTRLTAHPVDAKTLVIRGGNFTTIANQAESKYNYHARGIAVRRSNVRIENLCHYVTGEGDHGAPYGSFVGASYSANVLVTNCVFTAHKTYRTIGAAGKPVSMGSYDIGANNSVNVSFVNCRQTTDINDRRYWGIFGSNYCKNLLYDGCTFSRFDAHMGVANATVRNCELGYMGVNAIGFGTFLVENTTVRCHSFFNLRSDYGSTWRGEFIVRNCTFVPGNGNGTTGTLVNGSSTDWHDFGYACEMPRRIVLDGLKIEDSRHPAKYDGPYVFSMFNGKNTGPEYVEKHPYKVTEEVVIRNVTTASGKPLCLSPNKWMFRNVKTVPQVRVMTYNVRYSAGDRKSRDNNWNARRDDFARTIEHEDPDVIGFQEVLPDQRTWLEERFRDYAFIGEGRNADRIHGEASPVAYRRDRFEAVTNGTFWLSETPDVPGSKSWHTAIQRICTYAVLLDKATGKKFSFANTHTDHRSEEAREKGMLLIIERMKTFGKGAPVVFVGDHNCLEYEKPAVSVSKLLTDAIYLSKTPPQGSWRTFNYWSWHEKELSIVEALKMPKDKRSIPGDRSDMKRIDYIYVSPGTEVLDYRTVSTPRPGTKLYPSDHFPSVATVIFK